MLVANDQNILELFEFQFNNSPVYKQWCNNLGLCDPKLVTKVEQIPFLPIELFRNHKIYTQQTEPQLVFASSGTTQNNTSKHFVADAKLYEKAFTDGFKQFYGKPQDWALFALLPQYLEREESSLAYMVNDLHNYNNEKGGFFLYNHDELFKQLQIAAQEKQQIMLIGVTFALVEFAEKYKCPLPQNAIVMETGGMKGKRQEIERTQLHKLLKNCFGVQNIHSEYGMTEMLSQAYSNGNGVFSPTNSMKVIGRAIDNPLKIGETNKVVGLNIIDMANKYSCPFLATADKGIVYDNGDFEVLGRIEGEIIRGCNMLA